MKRYVLHICCLDNHISCQPVAATCRTQERLSRFFGKKSPEFSKVASKFYVCWCHERAQRKKFADSSHHCDQLASNLALFAAEFSLESCYLPYLLPPVSSANSEKQINNPDRSLWAKSHLLKPGNQWRSKQLQTPFRREMVAKEWLTYQTDTFQVTIKPGKKTCFDFLQASKVRGFGIRGGNSLQVCSESAHKHHGTHQKPLTLHLTSGACSLGIFQRLSRTCKTKDERTHTKMNDVNKFK